MPRPEEEHESQEPFITGPRKVGLHDRIAGLYGLFTPDTAADRIEAQELRQLVHQALQELSPDELKVIELRYQHKNSPGQVASRLGISRNRLGALERSGLEKIRARLQDWKQEP